MKKLFLSILKKIDRLGDSWTAYLFLFPTTITMLIFILYPGIVGFFYSFTNLNQYNMGDITTAASYEIVGFDNYYNILFGDASDEFFQVMKQTLIWTVGSVFFSFSIGLFFALILNLPLKHKAFFRLILLLPWSIPAFISAFAWRWLFNAEFGLFNIILMKLNIEPINWLSDSFWAMFSAVVTNIWLGFPFMIVILSSGLTTIPPYLYEASAIDGANRWQRFFDITVPLLKPIAFSATLLSIIWTFNLFPIIYLVTAGGPGGSTEILATYAYKAAFTDWELGMATSYGMIILSILVVLSHFYGKVAKNVD